MVLGHGIRGKGWCDEKIQVWYVKLYARKWYLTLFIARGLSRLILPSSSNLILKGVPIFSTFFSVHTNWQMNLQVQAQNLLFLIPKDCEFWFSLHSASSLGVCMCMHAHTHIHSTRTMKMGTPFGIRLLLEGRIDPLNPLAMSKVKYPRYPGVKVGWY